MPFEILLATTRLLPVQVLRSQLIVLAALLLIRKDLVSLINRLEFFFGFFITRIYIRVNLASQLAEGLPDRFLVGIRRYSECIVIILKVHWAPFYYFIFII